MRFSAKLFCLPFALLAFLFALAPAVVSAETRLFILSGQSNMVRLRPEMSFAPTLNEAFPDDNLIIIKDAHGGESIRRWYRGWKPTGAEETPPNNGDLYAPMLVKIEEAINEQGRPDTITFLWMQGERDGKDHGDIYAESLAGLFAQLRSDLQREDVDFVVARISDFGDEEWPDWEVVREAQVTVCEADDRALWFDTDDINGSDDNIHYPREGSRELGRRFAEKAIELIHTHAEP